MRHCRLEARGSPFQEVKSIGEASTPRIEQPRGTGERAKKKGRKKLDKLVALLTGDTLPRGTAYNHYCYIHTCIL